MVDLTGGGAKGATTRRSPESRKQKLEEDESQGEKRERDIVNLMKVF